MDECALESRGKVARAPESLAVNRGVARSEAVISVASRAGAWGLVGGFGSIIAFTVGAPVSLSVALSGLSVGLVVGGVGTATASVAAYRRLPRGAGLVRIASMLGAPLGVLLSLAGLTSLLGLDVVTAAGGMGIVALGIVVLVLLVAASVTHGLEEDGPDA